MWIFQTLLFLFYPPPPFFCITVFHIPKEAHFSYFLIRSLISSIPVILPLTFFCLFLSLRIPPFHFPDQMTCILIFLSLLLLNCFIQGMVPLYLPGFWTMYSEDLELGVSSERELRHLSSWVVVISLNKIFSRSIYLQSSLYCFSLQFSSNL